MTNQLTLRSLDIPSIHKFAVGFDNLFDEMLRINAQQGSTNYPPYNVVQINEDEYMISLAVSGFGPDNIEVTKELMQEDFPAPVAPAIKMCGILARFAQTKLPSTSFPSATNIGW